MGLRQLSEHIRHAAVGKAGDDAILGIAYAYRTFAQTHPGIYTVTLHAAASDEPELVAVNQEVIEVITLILHPCRLNADEMLYAIHTLRSLLHGFVDLETTGGFGVAQDRDESFRQLAQAFIRGLYSRHDHLKIKLIQPQTPAQNEQIVHFETDRMVAYFDNERRYAWITYRGVLIPETTVTFYEWLGDVDAAIDIKSVHGCVIDFRPVIEFDQRNLRATKRESQTANTQLDMSHIPVALIIDTSYQGQMVRISIQATPQPERKRIVKSIEEAFSFF